MYVCAEFFRICDVEYKMNLQYFTKNLLRSRQTCVYVHTCFLSEKNDEYSNHHIVCTKIIHPIIEFCQNPFMM